MNKKVAVKDVKQMPQPVKPTQNQVIMDKLFSLALCALFVVPFLNPYSYFPVSKFYSELFTLMLALTIAGLSLFQARRISISSAGIAAALFAVFLLLQTAVLPIRFPGINIAVAMEAVVAALLSIGITSYVDGDEERQKKLVQQIAWAALIGVTIQAIYGYLQYTGQAANLRSYILVGGNTGSSNVFGNIGQKNDYADFIFIGIFALAYLYFVRQINLVVFAVYAAFFGFIITINTSRTSFIYFILAMISMAVFVLRNYKKEDYRVDNKRAMLLLLWMFVGFVIMEAAVPKILDAMAATSNGASVGGAPVTSGLYRFDDTSTFYRRVYEWYKNIIIFLNHPIFGIGWYQYPHEGIYIMNTPRFMYIPQNAALYTHSHNSPLNILAETGIIGFGITMIYGFAYSLYRMFKNFNNYATLFLSFMLLTIFGQSCFQYPLWYAYFFMYFVLFLSVDKPIYQIETSKALRVGLSLILLVFAVFFNSSTQVYSQLVSYTVVPQDMDDYKQNLQQLENIVDHNLMWSLPALMVMDNYMLPTSPKTNAAMPLQDQLRYIDMLATQLPYPGAIFKQIIIHRVVGDNAGSLAYANLLAHAYPHFKDQFAGQLQSSPAFSEEVSAIYNFNYVDKSIFAKPAKSDNK